MIDEELKAILVCPACKGDLLFEETRIICQACRKAYPIRDGIPVMLISEAQPWAPGLLAYSAHLRWAGLVSWREAELDGSLAAEWGSRVEAPTETALKSWLVREIESGDALVVAAQREVGVSGGCAALPLRRDDSITGYLVLAFPRSVPRHVEIALQRVAADLVDALAPRGSDQAEPRRLTAVG